MATGVGDIPVAIPDGTQNTPMMLQDVLYVPNLSSTIVSLPQLGQDLGGDAVITTDGTNLILSRGEAVVANIPAVRGLHRVSRNTSSDVEDVLGMAFSFMPVN